MRKIVCIVLCFFMNVTAVSALDISAEYACVIECVTGKVLYSKNSDAEAPMASTTKIMTAIAAIENSNLDDALTISRNAAYQEGSSAYFRIGDEVRMEDVLYGLMLNSGNDAAVAIAEHIGGDVDSFCALMNETARGIGALNTNFVNPNGLYDDEHYTTAHDLAKITAYAMKNDTFRKIVSSKTKQITVLNTNVKMTFQNHNKLLSMYEGANGVKTGFTKKAGRCLVSSAVRDGIELVAVTLNAPNDWNDHKYLLDKCFSEVCMSGLVREGEQIAVREVGDTTVGVVCGESVSVPDFGSMGEYELVMHLASNILPPINKGDKIGECDVMYKGRVLKTFDLVADTDVEKKYSFFDFFRKMLNIA